MTGFQRLVPPVLLAAFLALGCSGGGSSRPAPAAPVAVSASVAPAPLTLYVPFVPPGTAADLTPYSGTVTLTVTRDAGLSGPLALAADLAQAPAGVAVQFPAPALDAGADSAVITVQAGSGNAAGTAETYPAVGDYVVPVTATAASGARATGLINLQVRPEPADFGLSFTTADGGFLDHLSVITLQPGLPVTEPVMAYVATGSYPADAAATLASEGTPGGWTVSFPAPNPVPLNSLSSVSILAPPGQAAGTCSFRLTATWRDPATGLDVVRAQPVVVDYSPAPFLIQPWTQPVPAPADPHLTLAQGATLTFPAHLWHDDTYFDLAHLDAQGDPPYLGDTLLAVGDSTPAGLQAAFLDADPKGLETARLQISAPAGLAPGRYTLDLQATRGAVAHRALAVQVADPAASSPTTWIQDVEWGQTVLAPGLRLVAGKPALLRVLLLADRPGVPAPALTATLQAAGQLPVAAPLTLAGPPEVPMTVAEGDLPGPAAASASSYTVLVPAEAILPGLQVSLQVGLDAPYMLTPAVDPGYVLPLTVVPILCGGRVPELPAEADLTEAVTAFWPVQAVDLQIRAPYTTATVVASPPPPGSSLPDLSADGWQQVLAEEETLRLMDGSPRAYYGMFNPGLALPVAETLVGLSDLGVGAGIGIDETTSQAMLLPANGFVNDDSPRDMPAMVMVHELGHAFNLNHAPGGGAGAPQADYPFANGSIGSWGYDPLALEAHDPAQEADDMSYVASRHWTSDWNYLAAMDWLAAQETPPAAVAPGRAAAVAEQWLVSGWIGPDGRPRLLPLVRASCAPRPPAAGDLRLVLSTGSGSRVIPFAAVQVPDLPAGHRHFCFTVPAGAELTGAEVVTPGRSQSFARVRARSLAARARTLAAAAQDGSLVVREDAGSLHLEWDPAVHPYVNVIHEGVRRTTLGLHLTGGAADLALAGLPAGGRWVIQYSDGLNPVVRGLAR